MLILHSRWEIRRKMTDHKLSRLQQEEFKIFKEFIRTSILFAYFFRRGEVRINV